jgi:hypothetical protein
MPEKNIIPITDSAWRIKLLIYGGVLGVLVGLGGALILIKNSEREGRVPDITPGEGVQVGLLLLGLLRAIASLGK